MTTQALLGVQREDGSISACYVHMDGYPEHMISAIKDYVDRFTTTGLSLIISRAQSVGGMSCFNAPSDIGPDFGQSRETGFLEDPEPYIINEKNWKEGELYAGWRYLVDYGSGEIKVEEKKSSTG